MNKQDLLNRFKIKTEKPLTRGFCEINGKKYYCLTNDKKTYSTTPVDSYTYYIFMRAFCDMAKSIGANSIYPEFVNVEYHNGYLSGDIITEDFSLGEEKLETIYINKGEKIGECNGCIVSYDDITIAEIAEQYKRLSEFYDNSQIYQYFIKHFLFHLYVGDEDFAYNNIEFFKRNGRVYRVSPMYDYGLVYYLGEDIRFTAREGIVFSPSHLLPEFAQEEYVNADRENYGAEYTFEQFKKSFYMDKNVVSKRKVICGMFNGYEEQDKLLVKLICDLEDKQYVENLLNINIDECLKDDLYNDNLKEIIKVGTIPTKNLIKKAYDKCRNSCFFNNVNDKTEDVFTIQ